MKLKKLTPSSLAYSWTSTLSLLFLVFSMINLTFLSNILQVIVQYLSKKVEILISTASVAPTNDINKYIQVSSEEYPVTTAQSPCKLKHYNLCSFAL